MRERKVVQRMLTQKEKELASLKRPDPHQPEFGVVRAALIAKIQVLKWVLGERWEGI